MEKLTSKELLQYLTRNPTPSAKCIHWHCEKYERTVENFVLDIYYKDPTIWDKKVHTCWICRNMNYKDITEK